MLSFKMKFANSTVNIHQIKNGHTRIFDKYFIKEHRMIRTCKKGQKNSEN